MNKFILMQDNEDGTTTVSMCFGEGEYSFLVPMTLDDWATEIAANVTIEADAVMDTIASNAVFIPNEV